MELGIDLIALLMLAAFLAGAIDAIAGGGGLITIPALMAAGIPPVQALATNKLQATFGTGGAVLAYARKGHIDFRRFAIPTIAAFLGSALGAYILMRIDPAFLEGLLPLLLIGMAVYFALARKLSDEDRHSKAGPLSLIAVALGIGCYDGFFGPGTGSFLTAALVAMFGFGLLRAVAHTKLLNFASNLAGLMVLMAGGHVIWITGIAMALANIVGGQFGAHGAMKFGAGIARPLLIVVSLALTIKLLADPQNPLTQTVLSWLT
ncbi:membrane protein [Aurantiacibacter atlanticus]|uniref:Probable membrane transporter protein n=1 Tax=Aurantiacibacter atlanticus TaxID=1648404 RepID=A0A0H4VDX8_9SPHN|nr:TSUP family transporter [Aurantiacibacter atlanticus]AKQ41294.1 membrane protein [Aurantiacibacter atlanticus]MDF1835115.1 TSUP family transporter [Alteraurantiacibacter sp. bin_em_oilr2.035]